jgi:hypothetical protein
MSEIAADSKITLTCVPLHMSAKIIPAGSNVILVAELEVALLTILNRDILAVLQSLVKLASTMLWVTNAGVMEGSSPTKTLVAGLAKSLMTEQPSLRLCCFDIEPSEIEMSRSAFLIFDESLCLSKERSADVELHLAAKNGVVYISRFITDNRENTKFDETLKPPILQGRLSPGLALDFLKIGQMNSFYYKKKETQNSSKLGPDQVLLYPRMYALTSLVCVTYSLP